MSQYVQIKTKLTNKVFVMYNFSAVTFKQEKFMYNKFFCKQSKIVIFPSVIAINPLLVLLTFQLDPQRRALSK